MSQHQIEILAVLIGLLACTNLLQLVRVRKQHPKIRIAADSSRPDKPQLVVLHSTRGLAAGASETGGKERQEDAWAVHELALGHLLVVADGISGCGHGDLASRTAVTAFKHAVEHALQQGHPPSLDLLRSAFQFTQQVMRVQAQVQDLSQPPPTTTLLAALDLPDRFLAGYVGDGAMVISTGNLQWAQNLLFPQTGPAGVLTGFLGGMQSACAPALFDLPKIWPDGGILVLGTDGALPQGEVLSTVAPLLREIRQLVLDTGHQKLADETAKLLFDIVANRMDSDDNRTLGLLISQETLQFWTGTSLHENSARQGKHAIT